MSIKLNHILTNLVRKLMKVLISHQKTRITTPKVDQDHRIVNVETGIGMMLLKEGIVR